MLPRPMASLLTWLLLRMSLTISTMRSISLLPPLQSLRPWTLNTSFSHLSSHLAPSSPVVQLGDTPPMNPSIQKTQGEGLGPSEGINGVLSRLPRNVLGPLPPPNQTSLTPQTTPERSPKHLSSSRQLTLGCPLLLLPPPRPLLPDRLLKIHPRPPVPPEPSRNQPDHRLPLLQQLSVLRLFRLSCL